MTDHQRSALDAIAVELETRRQAKRLKLYCLMSERVSPATVQRVFQGKDHRISTLVEIADLLDADVEIRLIPR